MSGRRGPGDLERTVAALRAGQPVVIPTDTVYGLAARADDAEAVGLIFALKGRPIDSHVAVLVADVEQAAAYVDLGPIGEALAARHWPGPLTIVARRAQRHRLAAGDAHSLGVRCPADGFVRAVAAAVGPIAATSANHHGEPTPAVADEVAALFPTVEVVVDDGPRSGAASTVVSILGDRPEVLREGPVSAADIVATLDDDS